MYRGWGLWGVVERFMYFSEIKGFSWFINKNWGNGFSNICVFWGTFLRSFSPTFPQEFLTFIGSKMGNLKIYFGGFNYERNNLSQRRRLFNT